MKFAVRSGYFYEHATKGGRQFFTVGLGLRYNVFGLDFSYLVPTSSNQNPLDNTLRFTLQFNLDALGNENGKFMRKIENEIWTDWEHDD